MINNLAILLSVVAIGYAICRAIILDRTMPWFGVPKDPSKPERRR